MLDFLHVLNASRLKLRQSALQFSSLNNRLSADRVFQGPPLSWSRSLPSSDYYIAFEKRHSHNVGGLTNGSKPQYPNGGRKMKCWVQFLSTPTADTPGTTLLLHFDGKRYLIGNVGEGTQRACVQRKLSVIKVRDVFITGTVGWGNSGGILGMILTIADASTSSREDVKQSGGPKVTSKGDNSSRTTHGGAEKPCLSLYAGKNITHLLATARRFVFRKGMPLRVTEFKGQKEGQRKNWDPTWEDKFVKVWNMVIEPENHNTGGRKRSHEEFSDSAPLGPEAAEMETMEEIEDRHEQLRQSVVSSMFDSEWRLDGLFKKKLSEVVLPAAIFIRNSEGKIEKYNGPMPAEGKDVPEIDVLVRNPWPGALINELPPTTPSKTSVCYIIKNFPQRGKFDPKAAIRLGVKPGPEFRRLTQGESVTTASGSTVTPEMVMSQGKEGGGFAIVELPDASYVSPLINREEWFSKEVMVGVGAIIWILGPGVVNDSRLQKFMQDHSEWKHVVSSTDCCSNYLALESPAAAAIRLHLLDPERFPIPIHSNVVTQKQIEGQAPYINARSGLTLQLEPSIEIQEDKIIKHLDTIEVVRNAVPEVLELANAARKEVMSSKYQAELDENQKDIPSKDAEVITLGTGSALPSKYRNVSATLIRVPGYGNYLLDCGENTLGQLKRVFGDELPGVLRNLKAIWISHLHADHHLGTAAVARAWAEETEKDEITKDNKLYVISHEGMINWLAEYSQVEEIGYKRLETLLVAKSGYRNWKFDYKFNRKITEVLGLTSVQACPVEHCHGAAAVVLNFPNGFKVAYSGDCRPSEEFVKIGQGATLLVHEATFDDELQGDAIAKKHSTTSEALNIGKRMNARRILLTHFSQRYQKIPVMDSHGGKDQVAIVAFDYMRVKLGDFAKLDTFKPALMKLYEDEIGAEDEVVENK